MEIAPGNAHALDRDSRLDAQFDQQPRGDGSRSSQPTATMYEHVSAGPQERT